MRWDPLTAAAARLRERHGMLTDEQALHMDLDTIEPEGMTPPLDAWFEPADVRPHQDRILVRPIREPERTQSGLIKSIHHDEKRTQLGLVLAIGPGRRTDAGTTISPAVNVGEHVLFGQYAGTTVTVKGERLLVLTDADILARAYP